MYYCNYVFILNTSKRETELFANNKRFLKVNEHIFLQYFRYNKRTLTLRIYDCILKSKAVYKKDNISI